MLHRMFLEFSLWHIQGSWGRTTLAWFRRVMLKCHFPMLFYLWRMLIRLLSSGTQFWKCLFSGIFNYQKRFRVINLLVFSFMLVLHFNKFKYFDNFDHKLINYQNIPILYEILNSSIDVVSFILCYIKI